jgi:2-polyprenyl-6-methoxyphenol hydroxylase-like FAD-dependent oxidoreductase
MNPPVSVLVVGAGPVGLALACHLRRMGVSLRLIEKRSGPSIHSKAIGLQFRVSEILARLGVVDRFVEAGGSPTTVNLYTADERLLQLQFATPSRVCGRDAFRPRAILIPQSRTEAILAESLVEAGASVEWNTELTDYDQYDDGVVARVQTPQGPEQIIADWLVGCDGAHSVVRRKAAMEFRGKTYPLAFFMADVRMEGALSHRENHVWLHHDGSVAALPLPDHDTWRLFVEVTNQPTNEPVTLDAIRGLLAARAPGIGATIVGEPLWLSDFRINCRMVDRMRDRRVFVAGDAAHIHSPTGGQGITTGMQDAANLAWKVARVSRGAPPSLLDTYDEERLPHAAEVLRETDRTTRLLFAPSRLLRAIRDLIVLPVLRNTWVQRRMFGRLSQLHVHYRRSSLSRAVGAEWHWLGLRAGDRAPDVTFTDARTGSRTTLFRLMSSMRPVVLFHSVANGRDLIERCQSVDVDAYEIVTSGDGSRSGLLDTYGDLSALYGLTHDFLCLLRPDGHVGLIGAADTQALIEYLRLISDSSAVERAFGLSGSGGAAARSSWSRR